MYKRLLNSQYAYEETRSAHMNDKSSHTTFQHCLYTVGFWMLLAALCRLYYSATSYSAMTHY